MLDYQRIVDDLRGSLDSQDGAGGDFLRQAAAEYATACEEVNDRLRKCGTFLRQGLRSEAIQLGENEPNLLDTVAILDFPERAAWLQLATRSGVSPPPPLNLAVAAEMNQAYAVERPLAELLNQHRLLALSRGPLADRIAVLRQLADLDAGNSVWQDDLQTFEGERQKEIRIELDAAVRNGDADAVARLNAELGSQDWTNPPSIEFLALAADSLGRVRYWSVEADLQQTAQDLEEAMAGFAADRGRELRDLWNKTIAAHGHAPQEATERKAQPALDWLQEMDDLRDRQQQQEAALRGLEVAVQSSRSVEKLAALHWRAGQLGSLPTSLEEAYQARLAVLERRARHQWWAVRIGIVAAAVMFTVLTGSLLTRYFHGKEVQAAASSLSKLIDGGHYEEAKGLLRDLPDYVREAAAVQETAVVLQNKLEKEHARQTQFTQQLQTAKLGLADLSKSLANDPGEAVVERASKDLDHYRKATADLHDLAKSDEDRRQFADLAKISEDVEAKLRRLNEQAFNRRYGEIDNRLSQFEGDASQNGDQRKPALDKLRSEMRAWKLAGDHANVSQQQRFSALDDRLAQLESNLAAREQEAADLKKITAAVGDTKAYVEALKDFTKAHPNAECTAAFNRAIEESPGWDAVAEWSGFAKDLQKTGLIRVDPAAASKLVESLEKLSQKFAESSGSPMEKFMRDGLPALRAISRRIEDGERIEVPLTKMFADQLVADVWMVEKTDGSRYYTKDKPDLKQNGGIKYIITFDGNTKGTLIKEDEVKSAGRAPQVAVAEKVRPILNALTASNWESSFSNMVAAISSEQETDPFLKFLLLQQVLETGAKGSSCFAEAYSRQLSWVKEARIGTTVNWLDPRATNTSMRESAAKTVRGFPEAAESRRSLEKGLKLLEGCKLPDYRWIGWLHKARDGRWQCVMDSASTGSGNLMVVSQSPSNRKPLLTAVGQKDRQKFTLDLKGSFLLFEGRPVYLELR